MSARPAPAVEVDVAVIGGGVLGTAVAARLSRTTASVCLLEAENDVCEGASKGNAGVAVAYYGPPGTPETALINASNPGWEDLCGRLSVPYRRMGAVMVALDDDEAARLAPTAAAYYRVGELLCQHTPRALLMTATPHNGKDEDFQLFMALLDGDRFEGKVFVGREVATQDAEPDNRQHNGADRHVQSVKPGQHEEGRSVNAG